MNVTTDMANAITSPTPQCLPSHAQMSIFTLGRLSNCSSGCSQLDVTSPLYTNFTTADTSMAVVFANSASAQLNNLLVAKQVRSCQKQQLLHECVLMLQTSGKCQS